MVQTYALALGMLCVGIGTAYLGPLLPHIHDIVNQEAPADTSDPDSGHSCVLLQALLANRLCTRILISPP